MILIIILAGGFITYKTLGPGKDITISPNVAQEQIKEIDIQMLIDATTAPDTSVPLKEKEVKRMIELTTAPRKASLSNQ